VIVPEGKSFNEADKEIKSILETLAARTNDEWTLDKDLAPLLKEAGYGLPQVETSSFCWDTNHMPPPPAILAKVWDDNFELEAGFNAGKWFLQADRSDLIKLIRCGFRGDLPADEVAEWMRQHDDHVDTFFHALEMKNSKIDDPNKQIGFEVEVEKEAALAWIEKERPDHFAVMKARGII